ncbi:MAG: glycerol-3-phosphate acyltransferase [Mycoplasmataceae bacterium]|nr:glycerol-3-phosphate acyltransferase [Mycoplasmataceae bacterium]
MDWINNTTGYFDFSMLSEPSFWIGTLIFSIIAYLLGSINVGQILSIIGSKNLGESGSKNFGATNAGRLYGTKGFIIVFTFDMLKSIFVALLLTLIATKGTFQPLDETNSDYLYYYASIPLSMMFVIFGHLWPIYFLFKGGKGVASGFGCVIVLNWIIAIISLIIFIIVILITRWTAWGSIFGVGIGCLLIIFFHPFFMEFVPALFLYWTFNWTTMISTLIIGIIVIFKHRSNIIRVFQCKEPFIKPKGYKEKFDIEKKD